MLGPGRAGVVGPPWWYWRHKLTQAVGANVTTANATPINGEISPRLAGPPATRGFPPMLNDPNRQFKVAESPESQNPSPLPARELENA
jgi:hypothetical protein